MAWAVRVTIGGCKTETRRRLDRGFDRFDEECLAKSAGCVNTHATAALASLPEPFLLYLHYMDPHGPYRPPRRWKKRFAERHYRGRKFIRSGDPYPITKMLHDPGGVFDVTPEEMAHLKDLYDDEIAYFDSRFAVLYRRLAQGGLLERTILVLVADHGEEFFEHHSVRHCYTLYDTEIRVPMVLWLPRAGPRLRGRRLPQQVANLDVVPTLLDYLGVPPPPSGLDGVSLRPALERGEPVRDLVVSFWGGLRAASGGRFKLIANLNSGTWSCTTWRPTPARPRRRRRSSRRAALAPPRPPRLAQGERGAGGRQRPSLRSGPRPAPGGRLPRVRTISLVGFRETERSQP